MGVDVVIGWWRPRWVRAVEAFRAVRLVARSQRVNALQPRPALVLAMALAVVGCSEEPGPTSPAPASGPAVSLARTAVFGRQPNFLAVAPAGDVVIVGDLELAALTFFDEAGGLLGTAALEDGRCTLGMAVAGELLFIASLERGLLVHNLRTGLTERQPLLVGDETNAVAVSDDERFVIGTAFGSRLLRVFDLGLNFQPLGSLVLDSEPIDVAVLGQRFPPRALVMTLAGELLLIEYDTTPLRVVDRLTLPAGGGLIGLNPSQTRAYVTNTEAGDLYEIDLAAFGRVRTEPAGVEPLGVAVSPDGRYVLVANRASGTVSLVVADIFRRVDDLTLGVLPTDVAFVGERRALITLQGEGLAVVEVIDP